MQKNRLNNTQGATIIMFYKQCLRTGNKIWHSVSQLLFYLTSIFTFRVNNVQFAISYHVLIKSFISVSTLIMKSLCKHLLVLTVMKTNKAFKSIFVANEHFKYLHIYTNLLTGYPIATQGLYTVTS
jgi:hypothetical protein